MFWFLITTILIQGLSMAVRPNIALAATNSLEQLVEINYPIDVSAAYKDRRRTHGASFGVHTEAYVPNLWQSLVDNTYYEDSYGKTPIPLTSLEGGYKYNFSLGALNFIAGLGYGEAKTAFLNDTRNISVLKYYARGMYTMDNLFPEPYIVPYIAGSIWKMKIKESEQLSGFGGTLNSGIGFDYSIGALIQLNWLDQAFARESLNENGVQNTFIDIFATQYIKTLTKSDPILSSKFILGLGLRLEF